MSALTVAVRPPSPIEAPSPALPSFGPAARDWAAYTRAEPEGRLRLELAVENITCAACMGDVERALRAAAGVADARVNLSDRRVAVVYDPATATPDDLLERLRTAGFPAHPFDPAARRDGRSAESRMLLRSIGVAGFGAMNVMLMSVSVWSGNVTDISAETRDFFHFMSALVALPCIAYAARPFFSSALSALRRRSVNMDVPISIGLLLATGLSLVNTFSHGHEAYFDSALMLLFFLLLGRWLDASMRRRTAMEAETLATLRADSAIRIGADGTLTEVPVSRVVPGDLVLVRPGERVPVDGRVLSGRSEIDRSLVTGETLPAAVAPGEMVHAGMINGFGGLTVSVTTTAEGTLVAEIERLIGEAQSSRAGALRLADRAARAYAPLVHSAAALAFVGWMLAGAAWSEALVIAIAVLIITCPCALALAVPAVQVVAAGRLFRNGILLNAGDAIERLAGVDTIVFDKTGTLTTPEPRLVASSDPDPRRLAAAGRLALASRHPLATALARAAGAVTPFEAVREEAGEGVAAMVDGRRLKLGTPRFCGTDEQLVAEFRASHPTASLIAFADGAGEPMLFALGQTLKVDAAPTVARLAAAGYRLEILSGDRAAAVEEAARALGIATWRAEADPAAKIARLRVLAEEGRRVLMVGDGLNDAPSLAAAEVSMSPVSAAHVAQAAADAVFLGERLSPVATALEVSRAARRLMVQNLAIAVVYNALAVPIAVLGHVTPLIAALAMSGSSLAVTLNAVRLRALVRNPAGTGAAVPTGVTETAR